MLSSRSESGSPRDDNAMYESAGEFHELDVDSNES